MDALTYKAPFLTEKLLKERIVVTAGEGEALFTEVVRYLILQHCYPDKYWEMFSRRIDEVWHQFVLFTVEYVDFCKRYFNGYLHHFPSNAPTAPPKPDDLRSVPTGALRRDFATHYETWFGTPLPLVWFDASAITIRQRVLRAPHAHGLTVVESAPGTVALVDRVGEIFSVTELAREALAFIASVDAFYVRELPGDLTGEEKIAIVETLISRRIVLLAP
jgi:hypothetical protein